MSLNKNFLLGATTGVLGLGVKTLLNIVVYPVILQKLGVDQYGLYVLLLNMADLLILMDLGLTSGMVQRLASLRAKGKDQEAREILSVGFLSYLSLAILLFAGCFFTLPMIPGFFNLDQAMAAVALTCLYIILMEAALTLFQGYFSAVLMSNNRYQWVNTSETLYFIIANAGIFILLGLGLGLKEMLMLRLGASVVKFFLILFHAIRIDSDCIKPFYFSFSKMVDLMKVSFHAMVRTISDIFANRMDLVIIARFMSLHSVAVFEFVFRFLNIIMQIPFHFARAIFPVFTKLHAENNKAQSRLVFLRISNVIFFIVGVPIALLYFYFPEIFTFFSGGRLAYEETAPLLSFAIPGILSYAVSMPANDFLYGAERFSLITVSSVLSALLKIVLALLLIGNFGLIGIIVAGLVMDAVQHQMVLIRKTCQTLSIGFKEYVYNTYLSNLPALSVAVFAIVALKQLPALQPMPIILQLIITASVAFGISALLWFFTTTSPEEKTAVKDQLTVFCRKLLKKNTLMPKPDN
ncbi:MAG: oligosaccharide flippase family protein [Cyanobacteria bacterium P01_H01_bin.74]